MDAPFLTRKEGEKRTAELSLFRLFSCKEEKEEKERNEGRVSEQVTLCSLPRSR
jgi:hypothetical protein